MKYRIALVLFSALFCIFLAGSTLHVPAETPVTSARGQMTTTSMVSFTESIEVHAAQSVFSANGVNDWTFAAGQSGMITAFADADGGNVEVTSLTHGLTDGDTVTIVGTTNYNGIFLVQNGGASTFEITDTWVIDDATGSFYEGDYLVPDSGQAGTYLVHWAHSGKPMTSGATFTVGVYCDATEQTSLTMTRTYQDATDDGVMASLGHVTVAEGDHVWVGVANTTGTESFTSNRWTFSLSRIE